MLAGLTFRLTVGPVFDCFFQFEIRIKTSVDNKQEKVEVR